MIKKYKQYMKESISNTDYKYPFSRILILINNVDEYYMVVKFIEDNFNIKINDERDYYNYPVDKVFTHVLLSVQLLYSIKNGNYEKIDDYNLLRFYTNQVLSNEELIKYISYENNDEPYFYEKDVLNVNELNDINSLLNYGNRGSYKSIYKQNKNVYESKILESLSPVNNKSVGGYIYYTKSLDETEMKEIYQILFDNGYSLGGTTNVQELDGDELENSLLFIFEKSKKIMFSTNPSIRNNITNISNIIDNFSFLSVINWYLIKDINDLNRVFNKTLGINDFIKPNINVYESLLDKISGPSKEEVWNNFNLGEPCELKDLFKKFITENPVQKVGGIFNAKSYYRFNIKNNNYYIKVDSREKKFLLDGDILKIINSLYRYDNIDKLLDDIKNILSDLLNKRNYRLYFGPTRYSMEDEEWEEEEWEENFDEDEERQFNESLLDKLEGPSEQEIIDGIKKNPNVNLWKYWVDGDLDIIKKIIGYGANPNYKDGSLLLNAIGDKGFKIQPNIDFVKFLIKHGADVNIHNGEPLRYACHDYDEQKWDNLELIKILLDAGADIHSIGDFCMQIAKAHNQPKLINFLNDYMDSINKKKVFKFKKFLGIKESLLDKISGPTKEEVDEFYKGKKLDDLMVKFIYNKDADNINYLISQNPNKIFNIEMYDIIKLYEWNIDLYKYFVSRVQYFDKFYIGIIVGDLDLLEELFNNYKHIINYGNGWGLVHSCEYKKYKTLELLLKYNIEINDGNFKYLKKYLLTDKELVNIFNKYVPDVLVKYGIS